VAPGLQLTRVTVVVGILLFDEPRDIARLVSIGLIISGIVALRLSSAGVVEEFSRPHVRRPMNSTSTQALEPRRSTP
jgi:hypothetical protein